MVPAEESEKLSWFVFRLLVGWRINTSQVESKSGLCRYDFVIPKTPQEFGYYHGIQKVYRFKNNLETAAISALTQIKKN